MLVDGHPGHCATPGQSHQLSRQGSRLAVARRRKQQDQALFQQRGTELSIECLTLDQTHPELGEPDLRSCKSHSRQGGAVCRSRKRGDWILVRAKIMRPRFLSPCWRPS
ncbi:hypothetical protein J7E62_30420 [Variovorax paradoxus]|nr:hypothetical protein [Variovorax paradoxus]